MITPPLRLLHECLLTSAARHPDKVALVTDGRRLGYQELAGAALRIAGALRAHGVRRGDRVAIYLENGWVCAASIYGALCAGAAFVVVNPQTKADKLAYLLADSEAAALVTGQALGEIAREAAAGASTLRCVVWDGEEPPALAVPVLALTDVVAAGTAPPTPDDRAIPLDLAALIYTSGSTGNPKGVMLTHQNMLFAAGSITQYLRLSPEDRLLNVLPLAFDYGLYQLLMSVYLGATLVLERSFVYPAQVLRRAREEQVTVFPIVPTIGATLLALAAKGDVRLPSVRRVTNTAAALPASHIPRLRELFPDALIFAMYGLTECKRVSYLEPELIDRKPTSVGRAIPGTEVFLRSPTGAPVPCGEPGILHVRGPHVMLGYWHQPELTAHMLRDGRYPGERILCTHDYFRMDEDGHLYFVGRTDDIIKTRGEKVSPTEVEHALHQIPGVRQAAVVGVPDAVLGEAVRAFVVLAEGATLTPQDVRRECLARLESFMVPQDVVFVAELPQTATGKVRRRDLVEPGTPAHEVFDDALST